MAEDRMAVLDMLRKATADGDVDVLLEGVRVLAEAIMEAEVSELKAVLVAGSEKAAAHRLGLSHSTVKHHLAHARSKVGAETTAQLVWILAPRLPEPEGIAQTDE